MSLPSTMPPACSLEHHHSEAFEPARRLDAWWEIAHRWVDFRPLPETPFEAELSLLASPACILGATRSSAYEMRTGSRRAQREDMVVLSLMQAGALQPRAHARKGPGTLSLCAPREAGVYQWEQGASQIFLALPRDEVGAALGREPVTRLLDARCALAPALSSQMSHAALLLRRGVLDETECAELLDTTRALALLMLRNLGRQGADMELPDTGESLHAARHAAALRFMEHNAHRPELDVAEIARAVACSRTRLYEAFAAQGQTVMGVLRDIRLRRAQGLLAQAGRLNVGSLAWRCGFADASGFSKLFRARFGLSPTEWHACAHARDSHVKETG